MPDSSADPLRSTRQRVLERDGRLCQACGRRAGDAHPDDAERGVTLDVYHLALLGESADETPPIAQLQTFCDACAAVRRSSVAAHPSAAASGGHMIEALVLAAPSDVQCRILQSLGARFSI